MLTIKIFLSSPGDVADERRLAIETVRALEDSPLLRQRVNLQIVAWDDPVASAPLDARETPQASVNRWTGRPADCDLTIVILWSRLGTPLPASLKRTDGSRYASGTVWEVEDAISADRPVFVYRRTEKPRIELDDPDFAAKRAQYDAVRQWFDGLRDRDGASRSGVNEYAGPAQFQQLLRAHLEAFIGRLLGEGAQTTPAKSLAAPPVPRPLPDPAAAQSAGATALVRLPRRGPMIAAVAALASVVASGWFFKGALPSGSQHDAASPEAGASPMVASSPTTAVPSPAVGVPAALPKVQLAGPAEVVFSKIRKSTYTVLALTPEPGGPAGWRLRIRMRLSSASGSGGMNFWDSSFRLLIDGVPRAPDSRLNEIVDSGSSKDGDVTFDVPNGTQTLALRVLHYNEAADLPLTLIGALPAPSIAERLRAGPRALALAAPPEVVFTKPTPATFTVLGVTSEARHSGVYGVRFRVRMAVPAGPGANFWDDQFRLLVDDVARAPDSHLSLVVDGGAALDGDVTFEVPQDARSLTLRITNQGSDSADLPLKMAAAK